MNQEKLQLIPTFDGILDRIGFGGYQVYLFVALFFALLAEGMEIALFSILSPVLQDIWELNDFQVSLYAGGAALGQVIGGLISIWTGDSRGRLCSIQTGALITAIASIVEIFMPGIISLAFVKLLKGIGLGIVSNCVDSFSVDIIITKYRGAFNLMIHQAWFVGIAIISAFSLEFLKGDNEDALWRELASIAAGFSVISCILMFIIVKESSRFLLKRGNYEQAIKNLNWICKFNNQPQLSLDEEQILIQNAIIEESDQFTNFKRLFTNGKYKSVIAIAMTRMFGMMNFVASFFILTNFIEYTNHTDAKILLLISSGVCILATLLASFLIEQKFVGRLYLIGLGSLFAGSFYFISFFIAYDSSSIYLIFTGQAFTAAFYLAIALYAYEIFNTQVRTMGGSFSFCISRLGSSFTPLIFYSFDKRVEYGSLLLVALINLLTIIFTALLPGETRNKELDQFIE